MGEYDLFAKVMPLVEFIDFNINVNVSVFETSIRMLGGLLSSHIIALKIIKKGYNNQLLDKAKVLAVTTKAV